MSLVEALSSATWSRPQVRRYLHTARRDLDSLISHAAIGGVPYMDEPEQAEGSEPTADSLDQPYVISIKDAQGVCIGGGTQYNLHFFFEAAAWIGAARRAACSAI
jgi:hypothetical protein